MVIKNVELETVCGITSTLPDNDTSGGRICRKIECGKVIFDQRTDEPEIISKDFSPAGKDTDDQFL